VRDELREAIEAELVVESEGWAFDRVQRVTARLGSTMDALVVWMDQQTAFTAPGNTVYISRRLLERLLDDDATAFVLAHEIAHHELGHVPTLARLMLQLPIRVVLGLLGQWIESSQRERDADLRAIEMCIEAGYDVERCLHALEHLSHVSLDYGDVDGVLGAEDGAVRSHPPTSRRIADVRAHAERYRWGVRLAHELEERKRTRKRRLAIAAGAATAAVALILIRRR
jgi:predicted Zn-dependent protease